MEKPKDIVIEEGKAMLFGFIIALLICGFLLWAFNVKAQIADSYIVPTKSTQIVTATGTISILTPLAITEMATKDLTAYESHLNQLKANSDSLASKYAKLYDSCKNKR